jgi:hypothetical protein
MGNRRFSLTTFILVGVALGALYFVGKTVTPPPAAPPAAAKEAAPPPGPGPTQPQKAALDPDAKNLKPSSGATAPAQDREARLKAMAQHMQKSPANPKPDAFNPASIDTSTDFWQHASDGEKGVKEMREKVAKALAAEKQQAASAPPPANSNVAPAH